MSLREFMGLIQYLISNNRNKTDRNFLRQTHVQEGRHIWCIIDVGTSDRLLCTSVYVSFRFLLNAMTIISFFSVKASFSIA